MNTTYEPHAPDWWVELQKKEDEESARLAFLKTAEKSERNRKIVSALKTIGKVFAIILAAVAAFIALLIAFFAAMQSKPHRRYYRR
jgi:hypothetical protein